MPEHVDAGYCQRLADTINKVSEDLAQVTSQDPEYDGPAQRFGLTLHDIVRYLTKRSRELPAGPPVVPADKDMITTQVSVPVFICTEKIGGIENAIAKANSLLEERIEQAGTVWDHIKVSSLAMQFNHVGVQVQAIVTAVMDCWDDTREE